MPLRTEVYSRNFRRSRKPPWNAGWLKGSFVRLLPVRVCSFLWNKLFSTQCSMCLIWILSTEITKRDSQGMSESSSQWHFYIEGSLSSRHISVVHMDNGKIKEKFEKCQTSPLALRYWLFNISCTILSCRTTLLKVKNIASVKLQINSHVFGSRTFEIAINFL